MNKPYRPHGSQNSGNDKDTAKKENTNRHVYVEPGVQIDLVKSFKNKYEASQDENQTHNKKQLFWSKVGAGLIFVYAAISLAQACFTRQSVDTAKQQFWSDQRPYVTIAPMDKPEFVAGKPVVINLIIKNSGKTPALNAIVHRHVIVGDKNFERFKADPFSEKETGDIIPQGESGQQVTTAFYTNNWDVSDKIDIGPNDLANWNGEDVILVFGSATYQDGSGTWHCTPFANRYLPSGMWNRITTFERKSPYFFGQVRNLCPPNMSIY
jgi:hypothetical protein